MVPGHGGKVDGHVAGFAPADDVLPMGDGDLTAVGHVQPRPMLMFSCVDNITRMQVALMHPLDVHDIAVTLNADNRALRSHWFVRENGTLLESSRGLSGIDEIKQLFGAKTLTVDTGADNAAGKLTFNIDGLARAIAPLRDACHWAGE